MEFQRLLGMLPMRLTHALIEYATSCFSVCLLLKLFLWCTGTMVLTCPAMRDPQGAGAGVAAEGVDHVVAGVSVQHPVRMSSRMVKPSMGTKLRERAVAASRCPLLVSHALHSFLVLVICQALIVLLVFAQW